MIPKRYASDRHFLISAKIETVRPKRNNKVNIDKCITYCEEGMNNLAAFIQEDHDNTLRNYLYLKEIGVETELATFVVPPRILCRDILIDCYLMTDQFDLAKSVVERSLKAKAWDLKEAEEQIEFIISVLIIILFIRLFILMSIVSIYLLYLCMNL